MDESKIAVNYNSIINLDVSGVPVCRQLPQFCFGLQTKPVQTQIDLIAIVTNDCFTNILKGEFGAGDSFASNSSFTSSKLKTDKVVSVAEHLRIEHRTIMRVGRSSFLREGIFKSDKDSFSYESNEL